MNRISRRSVAAGLIAASAIFPKASKAERNAHEAKAEFGNIEHIAYGFSGHRIYVDKNGSKRDVGYVNWIENGAQAHFVTRSQHPDLFQHLDFTRVQQEIAGRNIVLFAAAAFVEKDLRSIQGLAIENGVPVSKRFLSERAVVIIEKGQISILDGSQIQNEQDFVAKMIEKKSSVFQQIGCIMNGKVQSIRQEQGAATLFRRRFLISRYTPKDKKLTFGVLNITQPMHLADAVKIIKSLDNPLGQIKNCIYLDMGAVEWGMVADSSNHLGSFPNTVHPSAVQMRPYTNFLAVSTPR